MASTLSLSLRQIDDLNTTVVTVPAGNYGSTHVERLRSLDVALAVAADGTDSLSVILDLSAIEISGSSFLACLHSFESKLSESGRRLIVCGDQTGLIKLVNWSDRMHYQRDLVAALNCCALQPA